MFEVTPDQAVTGLKAVLLTILFTSVLAYPVYRILVGLNSRQTVSQYVEEHLKKQGTPTMGGLMFVISLSLIGWLFHFWPEFQILLLGFAAIGFLDDFVIPKLMKNKRGLGWKQKILLQILVTAIPLLQSFILRPGSDMSNWLQAISVIFIILFYVNAFNFTDGMDGLASCIGILMSVGFAVTLATWDKEVWIMAACIGAALIPFLFLNAHPAKIFMGDVGSMPLGALFGMLACSILFDTRYTEWDIFSGNTLWHNAGLMLLVVIPLSAIMLVELIPVPMQILSVKLFKRKIFPMTPIHHAFEKKGIRETKIVAWFALTQLIATLLGLFALFSLGTFKL